MDLEFKNIDDLKNRMMPALKIRVKELKEKNYSVNEEELWNYFVGIWQEEKNLTLADLVDDVLNANIDFSQTIQIPECKEGMNATICVCIKDLECKVINGRKINLRAGLEAKIKMYSNEDVEIITGVNNIDDIQTLDKTFMVNSLVGNNSSRVYVKDSLNIGEQDEIAEILKADMLT